MPNEGRGLPELFFKNRLDKKATELAEPEINKPAFGQGQAFKDTVHSPLLSIICLGTLIFGIFLKPSLCAHTNLDDKPSERFRIGTFVLEQESRQAGHVFSFSAASVLTLSFSHPSVFTKNVHLQTKLVVIHLHQRAKILDDNQCGKKSFFFFFLLLSLKD